MRSLERKHETMTRGVFSVDKRQQETREDVLIYRTSYIASQIYPNKNICVSVIRVSPIRVYAYWYTHIRVLIYAYTRMSKRTYSYTLHTLMPD